jgi:hypothetical protein
LTFGEHRSFERPQRTIIDFPARRYYASVEKNGVWHQPPAVLRSGTTFISLEALSRWLSEKASKDKRIALAVNSDRDFRNNTMTLRLRNDGVPPHQVRHSLRFAPGRSQMVLDGKRVLPLPAAPFSVGPFDSELSFYVPLRPILNLLGGWARLDAKNHRLNFDAPTYEFWQHTK